MKIFLLLSFTLTNISYALVFSRQDSRPKYFDAREDEKGLCDMIYDKLADRLRKSGIDVTIDSRMLPIKRILKEIEIGASHVYCGAGRNEKREKKFYYAKTPVYAVSNVVATHVDEPYIPKNFEDIVEKGVKVGALYGTSSATFLKKKIGKFALDNFGSFDEAFELLNSKKLKFFYYHDLGLNHLVKNDKFKLKVVKHKFRTVDQWLIMNKSVDSSIKESVEKALLSLKDDGELQKIHEKFF